MRSIVLILVGVLLALAAYGEEPCELCGVWQSNEAKTLEDIRANQSDLENSSVDYPNGFFGRLINEFSSDKTRAYFIDDETGDRETWLAYRAVDSGEGLAEDSLWVTRLERLEPEAAQQLVSEGIVVERK